MPRLNNLPTLDCSKLKLKLKNTFLEVDEDDDGKTTARKPSSAPAKPLAKPLGWLDGPSTPQGTARSEVPSESGWEEFIGFGGDGGSACEVYDAAATSGAASSMSGAAAINDQLPPSPDHDPPKPPKEESEKAPDVDDYGVVKTMSEFAEQDLPQSRTGMQMGALQERLKVLTGASISAGRIPATEDSHLPPMPAKAMFISQVEEEIHQGASSSDAHNAATETPLSAIISQIGGGHLRPMPTNARTEEEILQSSVSPRRERRRPPALDLIEPSQEEITQFAEASVIDGLESLTDGVESPSGAYFSDGTWNLREASSQQALPLQEVPMSAGPVLGIQTGPMPMVAGPVPGMQTGPMPMPAGPVVPEMQNFTGGASMDEQHVVFEAMTAHYVQMFQQNPHLMHSVLHAAVAAVNMPPGANPNSTYPPQFVQAMPQTNGTCPPGVPTMSSTDARIPSAPTHMQGN